MELTSESLDALKFKNIYVKQRIEEGSFEKEQDKVLRIDCFDVFNKDGYSHFFLVGKKGAVKGAVLNNKYDDSILLYREINEPIEKLKILDNSIIFQGDLNVIEILRMSKRINTNLDYLFKLGRNYLLRIDEILNILGTPSNNWFQMMFFDPSNIYKDIAYNLSIDEKDVETMDKIYFYKRDNLPLKIATKEEDERFEDLYGSLDPVPIGIYDYEIVHDESFSFGSIKSLRSSIDKNNRSSAKSFNVASKIYTK